jgi:Sporulation and spore germination
MIRNLFLSSAIILSLSSCRSPEPIKIEFSPSPVASPSPKPAVKGKTIALNIYQLDNQCDKFQATKSTVAANQPVTQAIAQTLGKANSESLDVAGYRVKVASGIATIDFRPIPNARKSLTTLANCEQKALFGSVRRTLTQNPALKIKSVQFTDRGQPIKPQ